MKIEGLGLVFFFNLRFTWILLSWYCLHEQ